MSSLMRDMESVNWLKPHFLQSGLHSTLLVQIEQGGSAITTGIKGDYTIHFPCVITGWTLLADQVGSVQIDIWKADYVSFPPTSANTIIATGKPTLTSAVKNRGFTANGDLDFWDRQIDPGDTFRFNIDSASFITRLHFALALHKPPKT